MADPNDELIQRFYSAFARHDGDTDVVDDHVRGAAQLGQAPGQHVGAGAGPKTRE